MSGVRGIRGCIIILLILLGTFATSVFGQGVPEEARRFLVRGMAAVESAKTPKDYERAVLEFEQAAKIAPDWPDVYFNLGAVQAQAENYSEAIRHYRRYLELAPQASDAAKVRDEIYKLEYRLEQKEAAKATTNPHLSEAGQTTPLTQKPVDPLKVIGIDGVWMYLAWASPSFMVKNVAEGSPAHTAGIKEGHEIFKINSIRVTSLENFTELLREAEAKSSTVTLTVTRQFNFEGPKEFVLSLK